MHSTVHGVLRRELQGKPYFCSLLLRYLKVIQEESKNLLSFNEFNSLRDDTCNISHHP